MFYIYLLIRIIGMDYLNFCIYDIYIFFFCKSKKKKYIHCYFPLCSIIPSLLLKVRKMSKILDLCCIFKSEQNVSLHMMCIVSMFK